MRNKTKISYSIVTLFMLRAWYTRQKSICNMHTDGKLFSLSRSVLPLWSRACKQRSESSDDIQVGNQAKVNLVKRYIVQDSV